MTVWKDNVSFILVEPRERGNIGSSARAVKNMGFRSLVLVRPADHLSAEARWFAHGAEDVLERAEVHDTLDDALADKAVVVGTTRRKGKLRGTIRPLREAADELAARAAKNRIAFVFGREDRGLTNEETALCSYLATIPTDAAQPSLNLAHSVLIVAYELAMSQRGGAAEKFVERGKLVPLYERMGAIVRGLGYASRGHRDMQESIMRRVRDIVGRSGLKKWEYDMLLGLCTQVEGLIELGRRFRDTQNRR